MAKVNQVNNGDSGSEARAAYNEAMKTVEVDGSTITGSGIEGDPLVASVGGGGRHTIQEEGQPIEDKPILNFVGNVSLTVNEVNNSIDVSVNPDAGNVGGKTYLFYNY